MERVAKITKIVRKAREELRKKTPSLQKLGTIMNKNQYYKKNNLKVSSDCLLSHSKLDKLIEAALKGGAYGAKSHRIRR